jgi:signal transduction histidine kinase
MTPENSSRRASPLLNAAAYLTTLAVFLVAVMSGLRTGSEAALALIVGIFVAFTIIESVLMLTPVSISLRRALFMIQGVLAGALFFVVPGGNNFASVLFVLLAAQAFFSFEAPEQLYWGAGYLVAIFAFLLVTSPLLEAILSGMLYAGIFAFMWAVARALQREQIARAESQRLAAELENANAQLREYAARAQALAIAQERTRMAREIHDSLGHHLTVLSVQLQAAQKLMEREPARAREQIATARGVVAQALEDVRQSVNALRQVSEPENNSIESLPALVRDFASATGIATDYHAENFAPEKLSPAQALTIYRTVQEGLTNAQKHAHATRIEVRITQRAEQVTVLVTDDGTGGDANTLPGYGLLGLRERVALLGGAFDAGPRAERGFALRVELPLQEGLVSE